jgi:hypothetical protein
VPAPIVVEVYAPQPRPQELAVLIAACSRAAAPNECVTSDVKTSEASLGVAIVRRDRDRARIELGLRSAPSAEWSTRDLVFQPGDDEVERYRAIGFAIGTLVARQVEPPRPAPVAEPKPPPPRPRAVAKAPAAELSRPASSAAPKRGSRSSWLDVGGSVGLGLIPGPPRAGGAVRAASELLPRSFFAVIEGDYSERLSDPALRVRWLTLGAGLGHPLIPNLSSLGVDLRLLVAVERVSVTAFDGVRQASAARWKPGVIAALDGHWDFTPPFALALSAETFIAPERTVVRSGGQTLAETPALGLSGFVGLRIKLR